MHKVSLIVATLGERQQDLRTLLTSFCMQARFISEVVIVDQHPDTAVISDVVRDFSPKLPIIHTRSQKGLSRARNHGLTLATGSIVAFPDDDCVYPEGLLEYVVNWFESNYEYDVLSVCARDENGERSGNRWIQKRCDIRPLNAFRTTFSSTLFIWGDIARKNEFDTQIGLGSGTPFGSGEETDFVLRLLRNVNARGRFDSSHFVVHPRRDMLSGTGSLDRAKAYGVGMGHVLRKNSLSCLWTGLITYNLVRALFVLCKGDVQGAKLCVQQTRGIWKGFAGVKVAVAPRPIVAADSKYSLPALPFVGNISRSSAVE